MKKNFDFIDFICEYLASSIIAIILLLLILLLFAVGIRYTSYGNEQVITGTVEEKYIKRSGNSDSYMVNVITEDGDNIILKNRDLIFKLKFDSSDIQAKIKEGKTYRFKVCGRRIRPLSSYQNIYELEEITPD